MENQNDINYICARWRDANTDPPPNSSVPVVVKSSGNTQDLLFRARCGMWVSPGWPYGNCYEIVIQPGDQWLDITDIPAIPRAAVQAAVDEIVKLEDAAATRTTAFWHGTEDGLLASLIVIKDHTGITPTDHFRDATKKEE